MIHVDNDRKKFVHCQKQLKNFDTRFDKRNITHNLGFIGLITEYHNSEYHNSQ